ncbi:Protein NOI4 [Linum grandiflorum]
MATEEKGRALPKFGEWDVNDPTTAEGFTVIFTKARDEKKNGPSTGSGAANDKRRDDQKAGKSTKRWLCFTFEER